MDRKPIQPKVGMLPGASAVRIAPTAKEAKGSPDGILYREAVALSVTRYGAQRLAGNRHSRDSRSPKGCLLQGSDWPIYIRRVLLTDLRNLWFLSLRKSRKPMVFENEAKCETNGFCVCDKVRNLMYYVLCIM